MKNDIGGKRLWDGLNPSGKQTQGGTHEHTHKHDDDDVYVPTRKNIKDKRIQILTYESVVQRMDTYAKRHGLSRAEVFEAAVTRFLDEEM